MFGDSGGRNAQANRASQPAEGWSGLACRCENLPLSWVRYFIFPAASECRQICGHGPALTWLWNFQIRTLPAVELPCQLWQCVVPRRKRNNTILVAMNHQSGHVYSCQILPQIPLQVGTQAGLAVAEALAAFGLCGSLVIMINITVAQFLRSASRAICKYRLAVVIGQMGSSAK